MFEIRFNYSQLLRPGDVVALENCQPVTAADKVTKDADKDYGLCVFPRLNLFVLVPNVIWILSFAHLIVPLVSFVL